jgi:hypothetical protein
MQPARRNLHSVAIQWQRGNAAPTLAAVENGPPVREQTMKNLSGRISENVLLAVLAVALAGWLAGSVAAAPMAPRVSHACGAERRTTPATAGPIATAAPVTQCLV